MNVVVVESPAKAKTINKYLGRDYVVLASYGHVRDLPSKDGSVEPDNDFHMTYQVEPRSAKHLAEINRALEGSSRLILATDPDREGEAISWHVLQALGERRDLAGIDIERVVFNAITKSAVLDAMAHPRELDMDLVNAQQARRALDYLVGFTLSPVLWRKLPGARSAGRVQSVALRLICERENEIELFQPVEYWSVEVVFRTAEGAGIHRSADAARRQAARQVRAWRRSGGERRRGDHRSRHGLARGLGRNQAHAPPSPAALHHLDPATGSLAQARLRRLAHDADCPAPL